MRNRKNLFPRTKLEPTVPNGTPLRLRKEAIVAVTAGFEDDYPFAGYPMYPDDYVYTNCKLVWTSNGLQRVATGAEGLCVLTAT